MLIKITMKFQEVLQFKLINAPLFFKTCKCLLCGSLIDSNHPINVESLNE